MVANPQREMYRVPPTSSPWPKSQHTQPCWRHGHTNVVTHALPRRHLITATAKRLGCPLIPGQLTHLAGYVSASRPHGSSATKMIQPHHTQHTRRTTAITRDVAVTRAGPTSDGRFSFDADNGCTSGLEITINLDQSVNVRCDSMRHALTGFVCFVLVTQHYLDPGYANGKKAPVPRLQLNSVPILWQLCCRTVLDGQGEQRGGSCIVPDSLLACTQMDAIRGRGKGGGAVDRGSTPAMWPCCQCLAPGVYCDRSL